jgi:cytochrome c
MKNWDVLIVIFLLSLSTVVMHPALAKEPMSTENVSLGMPSNETELISFVESAVVHAKEVGKENAIKDFMDLNGSWVRGDVYIFAHAFNGTTLVLPYLPNAVGTNRLDVQDAEGRYINREMNCIALHGSGFYRYFYRNPIKNNTQEKVSYVSKVDDNWWLGAGIYYNNSVSVESNATSKSYYDGLVIEGSESNCSRMWKYIQAADAINENLSIIDKDLERACEEFSNVGIQGSDAQAVLKRLARVHPSVIDAGTVDANGTFLEVEPELYRSIKRVNVAFREDQKKLPRQSIR